jgi:hypothetical protein
MISPRAAEADNDKVRDLLQKLSSLEAADKDVLSPARQARSRRPSWRRWTGRRSAGSASRRTRCG